MSYTHVSSSRWQLRWLLKISRSHYLLINLSEPFSTRTSDRAEIWHACADGGETGSHQKKLTNPTPEGFRGLFMFVACGFVGCLCVAFSTRTSDRAQIWHACADGDETGSHQKKLTNPTPEGCRGLFMFVACGFVGCLCVGCLWVAWFKPVVDRKLLERLMSPPPKSHVMFASAFSWIGDFFRIFGIHIFQVMASLVNLV